MPDEVIFLFWYGSGLFITIWLMNRLKIQIDRKAGVTTSPFGLGSAIVALLLAFLGPVNLVGCIFLDGTGD